MKAPPKKKRKYILKAADEDTGFGEKDLCLDLGGVYESGCGGTAVVLPCFDRRVTWQILSAKEAGLPYQSDGRTCLADARKLWDVAASGLET